VLQQFKKLMPLYQKQLLTNIYPASNFKQKNTRHKDGYFILKAWQ